ncbi:MAG: antibiotic biosynthesis monooxygenase, partial [Pseudomonadales bacterium]|nr:antibiotic biosynthesis monooxygenase [Pseudomonadales bacterium]
ALLLGRWVDSTAPARNNGPRLNRQARADGHNAQIDKNQQQKPTTKGFPMAIGVVAKLAVKPGKNAEFETIFGELQAAVAANEPGNNYYGLHRSRSDAQAYIVLEQYADQAALEAHGASAHFKEIGARMGSCLAGRPDVEYMDAV